MAAIVKIYVGIPENDKVVTVSADTTVAKVLQEAAISAKGMVQHNGQTLTANELDKTLEELGTLDNDSFYVVSKMDGAY